MKDEREPHDATGMSLASRCAAWISRAAATAAAALVRGYQITLSPYYPARCRFLPSCSDYAIEAIRRHGALAGGWLAVRRIGRCHPWHPGGIDEVPLRLGGDRPGVSGRWPAWGASNTGERDVAMRAPSND